MREGDDFHKGEIVTPMYSYNSYSYKMGKLYKITEVDKYVISTIALDNNASNAWLISNFRKATVEEILAHFNAQPTTTPRTSPIVGKYDKWYVEVVPNSKFALDVAAYLSNRVRTNYPGGAKFYYLNELDYLNKLDRNHGAPIHETEIPSDYIKLSEEEWRKHILNKEVIINHKINKNGNQKAIKVHRPDPTIKRGQRITGHTIRGGASRIKLKRGHITNQILFG